MKLSLLKLRHGLQEQTQVAVIFIDHAYIAYCKREDHNLPTVYQALRPAARGSF